MNPPLKGAAAIPNEARKRRVPLLDTRDLLICAVLGVMTAFAVIGVSPITAGIAAASPPLYALIGGYSAVAPLLALRMLDRPGAATVTALCCAFISWPFSALGVLLLIAQLAPALMMDLVYLARARMGPTVSLWVGAEAAALVIFALSLPIITPEQLTSEMVALTLVGRLVSYSLAYILSGVVHSGLLRAGIHGYGGGTARP